MYVCTMGHTVHTCDSEVVRSNATPTSRLLTSYTEERNPAQFHHTKLAACHNDVQFTRTRRDSGHSVMLRLLGQC